MNQNRKETTAKQALSCNYEYFKSAKTIRAKRLSEFFTDYYLWEDAAFAPPHLYYFLESESYKYAIHL